MSFAVNELEAFASPYSEEADFNWKCGQRSPQCSAFFHSLRQARDHQHSFAHWDDPIPPQTIQCPLDKQYECGNNYHAGFQGALRFWQHLLKNHQSLVHFDAQGSPVPSYHLLPVPSIEDDGEGYLIDQLLPKFEEERHQWTCEKAAVFEPKEPVNCTLTGQQGCDNHKTKGFNDKGSLRRHLEAVHSVPEEPHSEADKILFEEIRGTVQVQGSCPFGDFKHTPTLYELYVHLRDKHGVCLICACKIKKYWSTHAIFHKNRPQLAAPWYTVPAKPMRKRWCHTWSVSTGSARIARSTFQPMLRFWRTSGSIKLPVFLFTPLGKVVTTELFEEVPMFIQ
ncbi:hypothetical protein T439DRAFT_356654 [Meredithblackwellia eburnea MCA 4105]